MSQYGQSGGPQIVFDGPTFHVSGLQIVSDAEEVSLYLTANRHAFSSDASEVRTMSEMVARLIMSPAAALRFADTLRAYADNAGQRSKQSG